MSWEIVRLGDYCIKIGSGATPKGGATVYVEDGASLIRSQNVYNLSFEHDGLTHITDDAAAKLNGVTIFPNDILLNITGDSVARVCMVPMNVLPARVNQHVAIIRTKKDLLPQYLLYYLASPYMQAYMLNLAVGKGASRNALTKGMIEDFPLPLPSVKEQQRIVKILSPYSDLIENNQKQIKLLEEAAQRLYKEWFVDLRFPGHETTPIVDGIPEGWRKGKISDFVPTSSGGTPSRTHAEYYSGGTNLWVKTQELNDGFIFDTEEKITDDAIRNSSAKIIPQGSILMAMYGATIGKIGIAATELTCNQACCVFNLSEVKCATSYLYCWLKDNREFFISQGKGAAQPNLSQAMIKNFGILIPSPKVLTSFSHMTDTMLEMVAKLQLQNKGLVEARDRLLPKLMSGEIEV